MFEFQNTYAKLPAHFYEKVFPEKFPAPELIAFNEKLARELGGKFESIPKEMLAKIFSGQEILPGMEPISLAYAGHQFGNFVPQLGDGRAVLLGEVVNSKGENYDIQLKGSGRTPFSRRGDGRSSLGPVIREYILCEAMHHLGVPTTRALAAVKTGEEVYRDMAYPGGIFTRVARSHIRVGTFEYFAAREDHNGLKTLVDFAIQRHYPHLFNHEERYASFFRAVCEAQVSLVTTWMSLGFIHGVMNTDNISVSGETIDYGPCAFMDRFEFQKVFSSIDRFGRYSYQNQGRILLWNMARLADCLIPLMGKDTNPTVEKFNEILAETQKDFENQLERKLAFKLGIATPDSHHQELVKAWLHYLEKEGLDFTLSFRNLSSLLDMSVEEQNIFPKTSELTEFDAHWRKALERQGISMDEVKAQMNSHNPLYIPRNHMVELAIERAIEDDFSIFYEMNEVLRDPYTEKQNFDRYATPPTRDEEVKETFCGT